MPKTSTCTLCHTKFFRIRYQKRCSECIELCNKIRTQKIPTCIDCHKPFTKTGKTQYRCPKCHRKNQSVKATLWRQNHLEYARKWHHDWTIRTTQQRRNWYFQKHYGITLDERNKLISEQDGVCAICQQVFINDRDKSTDHDHNTNQVRGILCSACNKGLGSFHDNTKYLERAIDYLKRWNTLCRFAG